MLVVECMFSRHHRYLRPSQRPKTWGEEEMVNTEHGGNPTCVARPYIGKYKIRCLFRLDLSSFLWFALS